MTVAADKGQKRQRGTAAQAHALMMRSVPYFAQGMPGPAIAKLFRKSPRQIERWRQHPDVRAALGEIERAATGEAVIEAKALVAEAWKTLKDVMANAEDPKARVEAAKTTLSRLGVPERKEVTGADGQPQAVAGIQIIVQSPADVARVREVARGGGE